MVKLSNGIPVSLLRAVQTYGGYIFGDTLYFDNFDSTLLKWTKIDVGGAGTVALDATIAATGTTSLKVTTGALATNDTYAYQSFGTLPIGASGVVRLSCLIRLGLAVNGDWAKVDFTFNDGVSTREPTIRFLCTAANTMSLQYYNSAAGWTNLAAGLALDMSVIRWYMLEFDVDLINNKYLAVSFGGIRYPLNVSTTSNASTTNTSVVIVEVYTAAAVAKSIWIEEFMLRMI